MVAKMILSWFLGAGLTASVFLTIFVDEALGGSLIFVFGFPTLLFCLNWFVTNWDRR